MSYEFDGPVLGVNYMLTRLAILRELANFFSHECPPVPMTTTGNKNDC
jgi:hypothetical protein